MQTTRSSKQQWFAAVCIALALGTFGLYFLVVHNAFTNLDDGVYIPENPHVASGLHWHNIAWSFSHIYAGYWIPLTWISHMIDCQLFGLNPAGHHLINVLFHSANTVLLFALLNQMTGALWRSALVAALFAWHPLRVESVAWACERKDVLSSFFWMLTLLCYAHYAKGQVESSSSSSSLAAPKPGEGGFSSPAIHDGRSANRPSSPPWLFYGLSLFFFACGLMSKPMVVTLPFVLILLDHWPLQRFNASTLQRLIFEKLPFFTLSLAACIATYLTTHAAAPEPLSFRLINSLCGYARYISKTFAPVNLAVLYPLPAREPTLLALVGALLLLACFVVFLVLFRRRPYLMVGWLWFLGTLVPVIGIVQAGYQSMADRFTYIPSIGLFIVIVWGFADLVQWPGGKPSLVATAVASLLACWLLTSAQIRYWRDSVTLFRHTLAVTTDNYVACACLGQALDTLGDDKGALVYCNMAVHLNPHYPPGQFYLGMILWKEGDGAAFGHLDVAAQMTPDNPVFDYNAGKFLLEHGSPDKAAARFIAALNTNPDFAEAHNALGKAFLKEGSLQKGADQLSQAVSLEPNDPQFHYDLGTVLLNESQPAAAIEQLSDAVRLKPDFASAHANLAVALAGQGKLAEAIAEFSRTVQLQPNDAEARFNLGFAYLNNHQPARAGEQFSQELRLTPNEPKAHYRLAQALREQNQWAEAVSQYQQALQLMSDFPAAKTELDAILASHPELGNSSK